MHDFSFRYRTSAYFPVIGPVALGLAWVSPERETLNDPPSGAQWYFLKSTPPRVFLGRGRTPFLRFSVRGRTPFLTFPVRGRTPFLIFLVRGRTPFLIKCVDETTWTFRGIEVHKTTCLSLQQSNLVQGCQKRIKGDYQSLPQSLPPFY